MAFPDENGTPWVSKARLEECIRLHAAQHNGRVAYLREVASVYPLALANQEGELDLSTPHRFERRVMIGWYEHLEEFAY